MKAVIVYKSHDELFFMKQTEFKIWAGLGQPTVHKITIIVLRYPTFEGNFHVFMGKTNTKKKIEFLYIEASALKSSLLVLNSSKKLAKSS